MELLSEVPTHDAFTPLAVHQSQTPETFFNGKPVLFYHSPSAQLSISSSDLHASSALSKLSNGLNGRTNGSAANGNILDHDADVAMEVDIWVTSERFILFSQSTNYGISIPYPSISLHAVQRSPDSSTQSLFIQLLASSDHFDDHDPDNTISLSLAPVSTDHNTTSVPAVTEEPMVAPESGAWSHLSSTQELFDAISACATLHPDPTSDSEGDLEYPAIMFEGENQAIPGVQSLGAGSGLPPPIPGSGGWITADNVNDFFDEEGNLRRDVTGLGAGAGNVRSRQEEEVGENGGENGEEEETKWRRTE